MVSAQLTARFRPAAIATAARMQSVSPTLLTGKGFGHFDVISCAGGTLPTGDTVKLGRTVAWNTTAQSESTNTSGRDRGQRHLLFCGKTTERCRTSFTPGIIIRKFKFHPKDAKSARQLAFGGGEQIAPPTSIPTITTWSSRRACSFSIRAQRRGQSTREHDTLTRRRLHL